MAERQRLLKSVTFEIPSSTPEEEEEQRQRFFKFLEDDSAKWKDWRPRERGISSITRPGKQEEIVLKKLIETKPRHFLNDDCTETMAEDKQHLLKVVTPEEEEEQRQRFFKFLEDDCTEETFTITRSEISMPEWEEIPPREHGIARTTGYRRSTKTWETIPRHDEKK